MCPSCQEILACLCPCCCEEPPAPTNHHQDNQQSNRDSGQNNTNKNRGQNEEMSREVGDKRVTREGTDYTPKPAIVNGADQRHNLAEQVNSNGNLNNRRADPPPVKTNSSSTEAVSEEENHNFGKRKNSNGGVVDKRINPAAGQRYPEEQHQTNGYVTQESSIGGFRDKSLEPQTSSSSGVSQEQQMNNHSPERSEEFSTERKKDDFDNEISDNQSKGNKFHNNAALLGEETQKKVVSQNTGSRIQYANQRDSSQEDKNTGNVEPNSTDKTRNRHPAKGQQKRPKKPDDNPKGQRDQVTNLQLESTNYR